MKLHRTPAALITLIALTAFGPQRVQAADPGPQRIAVPFAQGAGTAQVRGAIRGEADVDHTVSARAGQTLMVKLASKNPALYFNINAPGAGSVSMFVGHQQGSEASVVLPADGTYAVRVYLMRNAARRQERADYTLAVAVTGQALPPLSGAQDAKVAGTPFHATAELACQTPGAAADARCTAGVIRRGRDGTATVELRGARGLLRRVLLVKGEAVASDSAQPMTWSRQGDLITVRFGDDERYELPDALLNGG